jgi:hypothetical protein
MIQEQEFMRQPLSPLSPVQTTEVFTFSEPLGRTAEAAVMRGVVQVLVGQEFPPADADRTVIVRVPNGNVKPVPTHDMFVKHRSDVFLRGELESLSERNEMSVEELLGNPGALLRLMRTAAAERRPIAPAA